MNRTLQANLSARNSYIVPPDYDQTPMEMRPLAYYIKDSDVVLVVKQVMTEPVYPHDWSDWAVNNPIEAPLFFSRPYPVVAVRVLGYSNNDGNTQYSPGFNRPAEDVFHGQEENDAITYIVNEEAAEQDRQENTDESR
jgi:hypothetical protein